MFNTEAFAQGGNSASANYQQPYSNVNQSNNYGVPAVQNNDPYNFNRSVNMGQIGAVKMNNQPANLYSAGQPVTNTYGQPTTNTYGQPVTNTYGQPTTNTYGQPTTNTYGKSNIQYGQNRSNQPEITLTNKNAQANPFDFSNLLGSKPIGKQDQTTNVQPARVSTPFDY